jgi:hypothetical protein
MDTRKGPYDLIHELADQNIVELSSQTMPYTRSTIREALLEAREKKDSLTDRQKAETEFYLRDLLKGTAPADSFDKRLDLFYHYDSSFALSVNPILGGELKKNANGIAWHRRNGAEAWASIEGRLGIYASLRDNGVNRTLVEEPFLEPETGRNYKTGQGETGERNDFSEMQGGISYAWGWGHIGLIKDELIWGTHYRQANIFSGKAPSYAYLNLDLEPTDWFSFRYIHASLVSEVIDSSRSYRSGGVFREVMQDKYMAANLFTFTPWDGVDLSIGNSIIYADDGVELAYLNPVMFYKSVDHTYSATGSSSLGQNSQMFGDISVRRIPYLHLYGTLFMDELDIGNFWDPDKHTRLFSMKGGVRVSGLIPDLEWTLEYTRTNPWTYRHQVPSTTFSSNGYTLGHYMKGNSEELFSSLRYKPLRGLLIEAYGVRAIKGAPVVHQRIRGNPNVQGLDLIEETVWSSVSYGLEIRYEAINDAFVTLGVRRREVKGNAERFTNGFYHGTTTTLEGGVDIGF